MKRILAFVLTVFTLLLLASCGEKDRILYSSADLTKALKLADYKSIKIDTSSKEFEEIYNEILKSDVENNDFYLTKTEGKVEKGDIANIDYEGKKDGIAFDGGTAKGYDLEIGSGSFIDGFEDGLIGVEIGSTVDLNLTFPKDYQNTDLAGKAVVFTVKVNYVDTDEALEPKDYFSKLNFKSLEKYEEDVKNRAIESVIFENITENSKVNDYPKKDTEFLQGKMTKMFETQVQSYYGMGLDDFLTQNKMTKEEFNSSLLSKQVYPLMDQMMPMYAIVDKEGLEVTDKDIENEINKMVKQFNDKSITADKLKEYYGEYYFENLAVNQKALDTVKKYAKIK